MQELSLSLSTGDTFGHESEDIWNRTSELAPALLSGDTEVLAAFSGLRPSREGGARVEREDISCSNSVPGHARIVVHNYGAGGTGFQAGYGMALEAVQLSKDLLQEIVPSRRARF